MYVALSYDHRIVDGRESVGFLLSILIISSSTILVSPELYYSQQFAGQTSPAIALWCVTIPVFDMVAVVLRRVKNGFSPFEADRKHIHHLLLDLNLTECQVL